MVAPPLDLDGSKHYDLSQPRLLEWVFHMIEVGRFRSFMTEPPCTTFSAAAYPALRSYKEPLGYQPDEPRTKHGNLLAFRSFLLLRHGRKHKRPCGKEQPRRSKMAWLPAWAQLLDLGFQESVIASCQFGSPHKKEFLFASYLLDACGLERKCPGGHDHIRIEGKFTKQSAVYTYELARHFAWHFWKALRALEAEDAEYNCAGHESVIVNDVLATGHWRLSKVWAWRKKHHINVHEAQSALAIQKKVALECESSRALGLLDSRVAKGALAKGRSTSYGLQIVCKKSAALQVASDTYWGWLFAPTRLNVADDPTRDCALRPSAKTSLLSFLQLDEIQQLHAKFFKKSVANWLRLCILLFCVSGCKGAEISVPVDHLGDFVFPVRHEHGMQVDGILGGRNEDAKLDDGLGFFSPCLSSSLRFDLDLWRSGLQLGFTYSLAFISSHLCIPFLLGLGFCCLLLALLSGALNPSVDFPSRSFVGVRRLRPLGIAWIWVLASSVSAMEPETAADLRRAAYRSADGLIPTRVARKSTLEAREKLLMEFSSWLFSTHGLLWSSLRTAKPADPEEISRLLVLYGQEMFLAGKAYGRYAETINAVASARPSWRKQLSGAWDLAFAWLADEPAQHHPALPLSILLAALSVALLWGWPIEA